MGYFILKIFRLRAENTDLRLVMLVDTPQKVSNESLSEYKRLKVHGIGVDKDLIVYKGEDGHIRKTDTELIDRVRNLENHRKALFKVFFGAGIFNFSKKIFSNFSFTPSASPSTPSPSATSLAT